MFINLLNHSNYTLMESAISIDSLIDYSIKNKIKYCCLVEKNVMYGTIEFYQKCLKNNLLPIIGLQINYLNHHYVLLPKNNFGFKNINLISSYIMSETTYDLSKLSKDLFIVALDSDNNETLKNNCLKYFTINGANPIAIKENYAIGNDDLITYQLVNAIKNNCKIEEIKASKELCFLSEDEAKKKYSSIALENLDWLIKQINFSINLQSDVDFINFSNNPNEDLKKLAFAGLKSHQLDNNKIYVDRLNNELDVIKQMNLANYFLVVNDYVIWAKNHNIVVGPGRGSAVGSLLCYCLQITNIDPIKYNLIFERFLNIGRKSLPDIDIDFADIYRDDIIKYLNNKYGQKKVAHILVFQKMLAKNALRDVGRILGIDLKIITAISKFFNVKNEGNFAEELKTNQDLATYLKQYPLLFTYAQKIINFPRQIGLHAAGVVLSENSLYSIVPIVKTDNAIATQFSMDYLECLGVIKVDLLSLTNLTSIANICNYIKQTLKIDINYEHINLNDQKTYNLLSNADTTGVFQLASYGMRKLIKRMKPKTIEDIAICLALYRPGPMQFIDQFIDNRYHPSNIKYVHNNFKEILNSTSGVIIYQEQLMEIIKKVCNYSYSEADIFRRIISKKKTDELKKLKEQFVNDAMKNNYSLTDANDIFSYIEKFSEYGFNHSHALAYAYISYTIAYLKANYPLYYYAVIFNNTSFDALKETIDDAKQHGIKIMPPHLLYSCAQFFITNNNIYYGYGGIKGIGSETAKDIEVCMQKSKNVLDCVNTIIMLAKNKIDQSVIQLLIYAGAFDQLPGFISRFYLINNLPEIYKCGKFMTADGSFLIKPKLVDTKPSLADENKINEQYKLIVSI